MLRRLQLAFALCLALLAGPALAQDDFGLLGVDNGSTVGAPPPSYTGPLDILAPPGVAEFWGLRAGSAAIAASGAKAVMLRKLTGGMQCDVVFDTSTGDLGNVITTGGCTASGSAASWCSGDTCFVVTLYGQLGVANMAQTTTTLQPTLNFTGTTGGKPTMVFAGAQWLTSTLTAQSQPMFISAVAIKTAGTTQADIFSASTGVFFSGSGPTAIATGYFGASPVGTTAPDSAWHALQYVVDSAVTSTNSSVRVDGTPHTGLNFSTAQLAVNPEIGAQQGTTDPLTGDVSEVLFEQNVTAATATPTIQAAICTNQNTYYGLGLTC